MAGQTYVEANELLVDSWQKTFRPDLRKFTADTARAELAAEQAKGFDRKPIVFVDKVLGRPFDEVKYGGKIDIQARATLGKIVAWLLEELRSRSPVRSGRYRDSHVVMVNGAKIDPARLDSIPGDATVTIVNEQPYARKIEGARARKASKRRHGRMARKALSSQARQGVYRVALARARRVYGSAAFFRESYIPLPDLKVKVWGKQGNRRVQRDQVYPAIIVRQGKAIRGLLDG